MLQKWADKRTKRTTRFKREQILSQTQCLINGWDRQRTRSSEESYERLLFHSTVWEDLWNSPRTLWLMYRPLYYLRSYHQSQSSTWTMSNYWRWLSTIQVQNKSLVLLYNVYIFIILYIYNLQYLQFTLYNPTYTWVCVLARWYRQVWYYLCLWMRGKWQHTEFCNEMILFALCRRVRDNVIISWVACCQGDSPEMTESFQLSWSNMRPDSSVNHWSIRRFSLFSSESLRFSTSPLGSLSILRRGGWRQERHNPVITTPHINSM